MRYQRITQEEYDKLTVKMATKFYMITQGDEVVAIRLGSQQVNYLSYQEVVDSGDDNAPKVFTLDVSVLDGVDFLG